MIAARILTYHPNGKHRYNQLQFIEFELKGLTEKHEESIQWGKSQFLPHNN